MDLADEAYGYLTTRGRTSGRPHEVEIWFAAHDDRYWLLSGDGDGADWVRNLRADPDVEWRVGDVTMTATAEVVDGEAAAEPRRLLAAKYQGWREGQPLSDWASQGLAVAITPISTGLPDPPVGVEVEGVPSGEDAPSGEDTPSGEGVPSGEGLSPRPHRRSNAFRPHQRSS